jgi:hypothetical protein
MNRVALFVACAVLLGFVLAAGFTWRRWFVDPAIDSLSWTSSPTELAPGAEFVCASGKIEGSARLEFELEQWQGAPLRARVMSGPREVLRVGPLAGKLQATCDLPEGPFEVYAENADSVPRTVDAHARLVH